MASTTWARRRSKAREAGQYHADGGDDRRAEFAAHGTDVEEAYNRGYNERRREIDERAEAFDHPLRHISRDANHLYNMGNGDISELASLIERLADYLVEKEERA